MERPWSWRQHSKLLACGGAVYQRHAGATRSPAATRLTVALAACCSFHRRSTCETASRSTARLDLWEPLVRQRAAARATVTLCSAVRGARWARCTCRATVSRFGSPTRRAFDPAPPLRHLWQALLNVLSGCCASAVTIEREPTKVVIVAQEPFSKRYMKVRAAPRAVALLCACCFLHHLLTFSACLPMLQYLTKKYLKRQQLRDFLRVVAPTKNSYVVRAPLQRCRPPSTPPAAIAICCSIWHAAWSMGTVFAASVPLTSLSCFRVC